MSKAAAPKPVTGRFVLIATLAFFGVVIGMNAVMATLAIRTLPGTEVDSPYQVGQRYNEEIAAARRQASRAWNVTAEVRRAQDGHADVRVSARDHDGAPLSGYSFVAKLQRPTTTREDHVLALREPESGVYRGEVVDLAAGQWELEIQAERGGERMFLSRQRIKLQ